jgi:preprotein translocase subunit SecG
MSRRLILIAALVICTTVAAVLLLHGTGEAGLRAAIRAPA